MWWRCAWRGIQGVVASCLHRCDNSWDGDAWHATVAWRVMACDLGTGWTQMLGMGSSQTGRMGRASMGRGREGEIVLIRKLPPASPSHPSTQQLVSHGQLWSRRRMINWKKQGSNQYLCSQGNGEGVCVLVLDKNLPIPATKNICYVIVIRLMIV